MWTRSGASTSGRKSFDTCGPVTSSCIGGLVGLRICGDWAGSRCLTDNVWVWPEGLSHYVEEHSVRLPREFIDSMLERRFEVPALEAVLHVQVDDRYDFSFWLAWSESIEKR